MNEENYSLDDLFAVVSRLRAKDGCPWDREQTHHSLKPYLIEEAYEVLEAIDNNDHNALCEELGDILLHVVFHTKLAEEKQAFSIKDVLVTVIEKMKRRHPHVFGSESALTVDEVWQHWEKIKQTENSHKLKDSILKEVPKSMPALYRADKIQKRASRIGFDWQNAELAFEKIEEELLEIKEALKANDKLKIQEEIGDLLFSIVNVARKSDIDSEEALQLATNKFMQRFFFVEKALKKEEIAFDNADDVKLDALWQEAKNAI